MRRFEYESEILAKLQHPGIAHVYASGTFDLGDGAQPWFAMELIDGRPLHVFLKDEPLSTKGKLELVVALCDAVQHAHLRGVVHRDLKPANVLVDRSGQPKVLDFGVARSIDADVQATMHTTAGELVGTLNYMSPEQLDGGKEIDARCDVYALGVIGYELLGGRLPHHARSSAVTDDGADPRHRTGRAAAPRPDPAGAPRRR
jgi:serine/threonine protein kinase